jgi:hypothetical protein
MPSKRGRIRHGYDILSPAMDVLPNEANMVHMKEENIPQVKRVAEAPATSQFYNDAQTYTPETSYID